MDRYLRIGDAAQQLGVSVDTMRRWADEGVITGFQSPGGQVKFRQSDIRELLTKRETPKGSRRQVKVSTSPADSEDDDYSRNQTRAQSGAKWQDLAPWEKRRAEVEAELAIERLTSSRELERADEDRLLRAENERAAEAARLAELKKFGRMCCWYADATTLVIRDLETFVTSEQVPAWLPRWEQNLMVQRFVQSIVDGVHAEKLAAIRNS